MSARHHLVAGASLVLCIAASGMACAAEHVVLESNSSTYRVGARLDADSRIVLADQEFVVLATEDGRLLRVTGPHSSPAAGEQLGESTIRRVLAQLLGSRSSEPGGLAGVRGRLGGQLRPPDSRPDPWLVHAEHTGEQCVLGGAPVRFWREDVSGSVSAELVDLTGGESGALRWDSGAAVADWPFDSLPVEDRVYLVRGEAALRSVAISLHVLSPELEREGLVSAAWLAARGCLEQARKVIERG